MSRLFRKGSGLGESPPKPRVRSPKRSDSRMDLGELSIVLAMQRPPPHGLVPRVIKPKFGGKIEGAMLGSEIMDWLVEHCSVPYGRGKLASVVESLLERELLVCRHKRSVFKERYAYSFSVSARARKSTFEADASASASASSSQPAITSESLSFAISNLVEQSQRVLGEPGSPTQSSLHRSASGSIAGLTGSDSFGDLQSSVGSSSSSSILFSSSVGDASSSDVIFDILPTGERVLKAASAPRLVRELFLCSTEDQNTFWYVYPLFMTFAELCRNLCNILTPEVPSCASPEEMIQYGLELSKRQKACAAFLKRGVDRVPEDFLAKENHARLDNLLLDYVELGSSTITASLRQAMQQNQHAQINAQPPITAQDFLARLYPGCSEPIADRYSLARWQHVLSSGEINATTLGSTFVRMDLAYFQALRFREFVDLAWTKNKGETAQNLCAYIAMFNRVARWVISVIVSCLALKQRVGIVELLIDTCTFLAQEHDYTGVMALFSGLSSSAVARLKSTWDAVSQEHLSQMEKLKELTAFAGNYRCYRAAFASATDAIPYIGLVLTDLTFHQDGNPQTLPSRGNQASLINWGKQRRCGEIISDVLQKQSSNFFYLAPNEALLQQLLVLDSIDEQEAFAASLQIEPRNSILHIENLLVQLDEQKACQREAELKYEALQTDHQNLQTRFDQISAENQQLMLLLAQADPEALRSFKEAAKMTF